jgi:hypothetical protein
MLSTGTVFAIRCHSNGYRLTLPFDKAPSCRPRERCMRRILDKHVIGLVWKGFFMVGVTCRHHRGTLCLLVTRSGVWIESSTASPRPTKHWEIDKPLDLFIPCSDPLAQWFTIRIKFQVRSLARLLCLNIPSYQLTRDLLEQDKGCWWDGVGGPFLFCFWPMPVQLMVST